jgi:hypothetical protein
MASHLKRRLTLPRGWRLPAQRSASLPVIARQLVSLRLLFLRGGNRMWCRFWGSFREGHGSFRHRLLGSIVTVSVLLDRTHTRLQRSTQNCQLALASLVCT